jgi:hypothetical protein
VRNIDHLHVSRFMLRFAMLGDVGLGLHVTRCSRWSTDNT